MDELKHIRRDADIWRGAGGREYTITQIPDEDIVNKINEIVRWINSQEK